MIFGIPVLGAVSDKCPGFCKCLKLPKSWFAIFSNSAGHQKWPALSESDGQMMMDMAEKNKVYLNSTDKLYPLVHVIIRLYGY